MACHVCGSADLAVTSPVAVGQTESGYSCGEVSKATKQGFLHPEKCALATAAAMAGCGCEIIGGQIDVLRCSWSECLVSRLDSCCCILVVRGK